MRRVVAMVAFALTATTGCATANTSLQSAISVHNSVKRVVETLDSAVKPAYEAAGLAADAAYPDDNSAYSKAMAPLDVAVKALNAGKQAEQLIQLGVAQWQSGVVGGEAMAREMAACGVESIGGLAKAAALIPGAASVLGPMADLLKSDLLTLADGATCPEGHQ